MALDIIFKVFVGSVGVTFLAWLIVHFNGKTLIAIIDLLTVKVFKQTNWLSIATEAEVILLGLSPLAIASLMATAGGNCHNSIQALIITEAIIFSLFLFIPNRLKRTKNFFGEQFYRSHWVVFVIAIIWCLVFAIWGYLAINPTVNYGIDRLLVNGNGDMWFYVRRFAAYTVNNVSFDNEPACFYLQSSPKKLSSFIGSVIVDISPNSVFGITLFQGLLGCSLFLSLFGNWYQFNYQNKSLSQAGTIWAIAWAVFSPSVFWLIISSYLSNALFVTIFVLGLTAARRVCLNSHKYVFYTEPILLFVFLLNVFSFYIVLLPVALIFYLATIFIYRNNKFSQPLFIAKSYAKILLYAGVGILLCCILFNHQVNLSEVGGNLNALKEHGKNFVPLNPWSLVQEKPNPMPNIKDFGVWFNIVLGSIFSWFVIKAIYRNLLIVKQNQPRENVCVKDLTAAILVMAVYLIYLAAYIPLEYTYRLGKFAVSILFPLATMATLPTILWFRERVYRKKSNIFRLGCSFLLVVHIILHIDKTLYLKAQPVGKYQIITANNLNKIESLTIVTCLNASSSQKYQKILALDLAKKYPNLAINTITNKDLMNNFPVSNAVIRGKDVVGENKNLCIFKIEL